MAIISSLVNKNFSRSPEYYDDWAITQQEVAERLGGIIVANLGKRYLNVLEIGCGTGFLSEILTSETPDSSFLITDISESMVEYCRKKLERRNINNLKFKVNDITEKVPGSNYDLICSSLSFQWVENISHLLKSLHFHLNDGGYIVFSTLLEGTFANVAEIFRKHNVDFPIPKLPSLAQLEKGLGYFKSEEITEGTYIEKYNSIKDFLDHIHKVGAGNATGGRIPLNKLRKIIKQEKAKGEIIAEYKVAFVVAKK